MLYSTVNDESDIHGHKKEFFDLQFDVICYFKIVLKLSCDKKIV